MAIAGGALLSPFHAGERRAPVAGAAEVGADAAGAGTLSPDPGAVDAGAPSTDPGVVAMTAPQPVETCEPIIPCTDPIGCPDLVVDRRAMILRYVETRTFDAATCAVQEGLIQAGTRRLLRFGTLTPNIGEGGIFIGAPEDHPQWFEFNTCHGHAHFGEYADYRLWTIPAYLRWIVARAAHPDVCPRKLFAEHPELLVGLTRGHKQGFCLLDSAPSNYLTCNGVQAPGPNFTDCDDQGLSRCWADYYRPGLDGQWIDVTGLAGGWYVFETEVNPARRFTETDYNNNAATALINLPPP
ncbi:MAG TPA: lysyl oxidase family protein [Verrucomicrobiae bacterium]|nr:lysyl oxidase family protein [Verrucomicrobiae bacterium]